MEPSENPISKDMMLGDIVSNYPESVPVITGYGLHCIGCHISPFETLEQGCKGHGVPDEMIDELLNDANEAVRLSRNMELELTNREDINEQSQ